MLFPTLEEGFGFPLLEALTFGTPVIASMDPALVEVAAGAALVTHLDATDPQAWIDAIVARGTRVPPTATATRAPADRRQLGRERGDARAVLPVAGLHPRLRRGGAGLATDRGTRLELGGHGRDDRDHQPEELVHGHELEIRRDE